MTQAHTTSAEAPRRRPVQARSAERVKRILDATAELIDGHGVAAAGTSEIARRADVTLASLYRYFPNRAAVLRALAERQLERLRVHLDRFLEDFDLDRGLDELIKTYARFYREEPGCLALWAGMPAMPELQELDRRDLLDHARAIAARARHAFPDADEDELFVAGMTISRATGAVLRLAVTLDDRRGDALLAEARVMIRGYIRERFPETG